MKRFMSCAGVIGLLCCGVGCETGSATTTASPGAYGSPVPLAAGDALGFELMDHYVASVESDLYFASEPGDDRPD